MGKILLTSSACLLSFAAYLERGLTSALAVAGFFALATGLWMLADQSSDKPRTRRPFR